jgi:O-antigen ligase
MLPLGSRGRSAVWFGVLVGLQILLVFSLLGVDARNPISIVIPVLLVAPFVLILLLAVPAAGVLLAPLLLIVPVWVFGFTVSEMILLAAVFLAGLRFVVSPQRIEAPWAVEVVFAVYVVWAAMSLFQAVDLKAALGALKVIIMFFITFIAGMRVLGRRWARSALHVVALLGILIGIQLTIVVLDRGFSLHLLLLRVGSMTDLGWGFSVYVAAVAALTVAASLPLAFYGQPWERGLGIGGLISAVFVSLATLSRGGTLAMAVGFLIATMLEFKRRFLLAVLIITALTSAYLLSPLGQATLERFVRPEAFTSVAARLIFYRETLHIIAEHPLFGIGPGQIPHHTAVYIGENPHNFLLKNAADLGLPGLALYLLLLLLLAARIRRFRSRGTREARFFGLCLTLLLAIALTNASYEPTLGGWVYGCVFWLTAGTLYRAAEMERPGAPAVP